MRSLPILVLLLAASSTAHAQGVTVPPDWVDALGAGRAHLDMVLVRHGSVAISLRRGRQVWVPDGDCRDMVAAVRPHAPIREIRGSAFPLAIQLGRIRSGGRTIFDTSERLCGFEPSMPTDSLRLTTWLVSAVGPWVTVSMLWDMAEGGGPPYHGQEWRTLDARTGRPANLMEIFDEDEIVRALRPHVFASPDDESSDEEDRRLGEARDWRAVEAVLRDHGWRGGFGFASYSARRGALLVLAMEEEQCGLCPNDATFVSVRVRPNDGSRAHFEGAAAGRGHLRSTGRVRVD